MYLTLGGRVQRPLTSGSRGWLADQTLWSASKTPWLIGPTLQPITGWLHSDTLQEVITGNPKPKVGGRRTSWLPSHVDRPIDQHLVSK
jgi:hypothetical protein